MTNEKLGLGKEKTKSLALKIEGSNAECCYINVNRMPV